MFKSPNAWSKIRRDSQTIKQFAYQGKDIVFRFIIELVGTRDIRTQSARAQPARAQLVPSPPVLVPSPVPVLMPNPCPVRPCCARPCLVRSCPIRSCRAPLLGLARLCPARPCPCSCLVRAQFPPVPKTDRLGWMKKGASSWKKWGSVHSDRRRNFVSVSYGQFCHSVKT